MSTVVPTLCWIPKGVAKRTPDKVELSKEEVQIYLEAAQDQLKSLGIGSDECTGNYEGSSPAEGRESAKENEDSEQTIEEMYGLDHYDSDEEEGGEKVSGAGMGNNLAGLSYYPSNNEDPYITLKNQPVDEEDREDYEVLPTDNLLVVGRAEEDFSSIEIHVFGEEDDHSYSHHEILLTAFPLALEWLDYDPEQPHQKGNYIAVGTMTPVVEVWDLDTIDVLEPVFCLGDVQGIPTPTATKEKKKKKKKKKSGNDECVDEGDAGGHSDAVLDISWNPSIRNILATASADCTVRVWDLAWPKTVLVLPHPDKVQCCKWHPFEAQILATGAYDGIVRLFDCKTSKSAVLSWNVNGEVEKLIWNQFKPEQLLAASENQKVWCLNKNDGSVVFQIHAHHSDVVDLSLSCYMPGLLVTAGTDDCIKFWDIQENKPVFLLSRDMHMGGVMCCKFCVDSPYALAVGGNKNGFHLLNVQLLPDVAKRFKKRNLLMPVSEAMPTNQDGACVSSSDQAVRDVECKPGGDEMHSPSSPSKEDCMMDTSEETTVLGVVKELDSDVTSCSQGSKKSHSSVKTKNKFKKKHKTKIK